MTTRALQAAERLAADGVDVAVTHVPTIKPLDHETIARAASGGRLVVTLENHTVVGARPGDSMPVVKRIGLPDEFLLAGALPTLHERYGLSTDRIVASTRGWLWS